MPKSVTPTRPRPKVACHILLTRERAGATELLLLRRIKPPYLGKLAIPGGKLEADESLLTCAHRELREETGLEVASMQPKIMIHERSSSPDWQWLITLYHAQNPSGDLIVDGPEGRLEWFSLHDLETLDITPLDKWLYRRALEVPDGQTILESVFYPNAAEGDLETYVIEAS